MKIRPLHCFKHDDKKDEWGGNEPVELVSDPTRIRFYCPREGCDTEWTYEKLLEDSCQRCGDTPDPDLRTLWMACFYAMDEMPIPFHDCAILGQYRDEVVEIKSNPLVREGIKMYASYDITKEAHRFNFYTLRVCKNCRADWMGYIRRWYEDKPTNDEIQDGDIPLRVLGAVRPLPDYRP